VELLHGHWPSSGVSNVSGFLGTISELQWSCKDPAAHHGCLILIGLVLLPVIEGTVPYSILKMCDAFVGVSYCPFVVAAAWGVLFEGVCYCCYCSPWPRVRRKHLIGIIFCKALDIYSIVTRCQQQLCFCQCSTHICARRGCDCHNLNTCLALLKSYGCLRQFSLATVGGP